MLLELQAPKIFPIVWGITDVLIAFGVLNAWFKSSRVTINSTGVRITNRYLVFGRTRLFPSAEVVRFATAPGMQSGSKTYTDIKLVRRSDEQGLEMNNPKTPIPPQLDNLVALRLRAARSSGVTIAGGIANIAEADWLAQEMMKALGSRG